MNSKISSLQLADSAWPKLGSNAQNTGTGNYSTYADGTLKWYTDTITTIKPITSSPVISATDNIYIVDRDGIFRAFGNDLGQVGMYDTGGEDVRSRPTIGPDGTIYFSCMSGNIYAIGNPNWVVSSTYRTIETSPVVNSSNGEIYVTSTDGYLYAISSANGSYLWNVNLGSPSHTTPALNSTNNRLYVGTDYGELRCITQMEAKNGDIIR